ncbi:PD-(D/E)XK nuclease family protein [Agromyces allii]|nr:PD-(D/E)XK nuclease family protein [Agromyces allii]
MHRSSCIASTRTSSRRSEPAMRTHHTGFGSAAIEKLRAVVAEAKQGNPLAPVTIIVRDNIAAISARRALASGIGDHPGVAAVNVLTLRRLAEQLLAAASATLPPVTSARLTAIWRSRLAQAGGCFEPVAHHSATIRALVRAHHELRGLDEDSFAAITASGELGADLVRLHHEVTLRALDGRRDEVAVLEAAVQLLRQRDIDVALAFGRVIVYLPGEPSPVERAFLQALDGSAAPPVMTILGMTDLTEVDEPLAAAFGQLRAADGTDSAQQPDQAHATRILHASDSDDEVRAVTREVRALLADGAAAHRVAVLHSQAVPYSRLLHNHLAAAGIAANGPGGRPLRDRAVADAFLTLLMLDPDDLRRVAFFDWLGRAPIRLGEDGASVPRTRWERLSREAGITGGDWAGRLADHEARHQARLVSDRDDPDASPGSIAYRERSIAESQALAVFVSELRRRLEEGRALGGWAAFGEWALALLHRYFGRSDAMNRLPEEEQRAATAIEQTLGGLAELDGIGMPPTLGSLVEILEVDLDGRTSRVGRYGDGVFVGPIDAALSLDADHVFVVGLSEDLYPGRAHVDPILPDAVRVQTAGALDTAGDRLRRRHRALLAAFAAGDVTASFPRGDLRRGAERLPSRWLMPTLRAITGRPDLEATRWSEASGTHMRSVASHWEGVARADRPGTEQEWRLRHLVGESANGRQVGLPGDTALTAALDLIRARGVDAFTRFDGNLAGTTGLPDYASGTDLVSPTALEKYADCAHAFFVERLLGVRPLETPEEIIRIRPWDLGSIIHTVLDRLTEESPSLPDFGEPWTAAHRARMHEIAEAVMADFERRGLTGHPRLWAPERVQVHRDLDLALDLDDAAHAARDSRILESELPFGMHGKAAVRVEVEGGVVAMRGSADRVDVTRDGTLLVTDFKTGSARGFSDIPKDPVVAGTKLQLPLYAHAARDAFGNERVEAGYWFIGRKNRGDRIDVVLDEQLERTYVAALATLVAGIRDGYFIAKPPSADDFAWIQCPFCNPDGVGYGHVRGPSERKRTDASLRRLYSLIDPSAVPSDASDGVRG